MSNNINFINKVFFTQKDNDISGTAQRDPLGLQPIWSYYGRQVINHLTTISTNIHGYIHQKSFHLHGLRFLR